MRLYQIAAVSAWAQLGVYAHSHMSYFIIDGDAYQGYDPKIDNPSLLAAWSTSVEEDGWIGFGSYDLPDIVCHVNATNPLGYAPVAAGDRIHLQWMGWPEGHHGPVLTYLAHCGDDSQSCAEKDKTELEFFEIGRAGLLDPDVKSAPYETANGYWATDELISRNHTWMVEIPPAISAGFYVLRHELIALHYATNPGLGPQHYPQCLSLEVTGEGTERPEGLLGTELYKVDEPGLVYDIYAEELPPYEMPGPTMLPGAVGMVNQASSSLVSWVSAVPAATAAP